MVLLKQESCPQPYLKLNKDYYILGCHCVSETQYQYVLVPSIIWTQISTHTGAADSSVECGIRCSVITCLAFKLVNGVCQISDSWIPETTEQPSVAIYRALIGELSQGFASIEHFSNKLGD